MEIYVFIRMLRIYSYTYVEIYVYIRIQTYIERLAALPHRLVNLNPEKSVYFVSNFWRAWVLFRSKVDEFVPRNLHVNHPGDNIRANGTS